MTSTIFYTLSSVILVSLISLVGLFILSVRETVLRKGVFLLVSLAAGALIGDAFLHLIPEAFEESQNPTLVSLFILIGLMLFFILEKFLHWHHTHGKFSQDVSGYANKPAQESETHSHIYHEKDKHLNAWIILISDGVHNLLDGIIIAISFMASVEIGFATTLAVILHEIPQEIGDFGVLLHSGYSRKRALLLNFLSALLAVFGAVLALVLGESTEFLTQWILPITAGGFIYVAASDLIPEMHKIRKPLFSFLQIILLVVGVVAMWSLLFLEENHEQNGEKDLVSANVVFVEEGATKNENSEFCFLPGTEYLLGMEKTHTTPQVFVSQKKSVVAAINGTYFDPNGEVLGIAYESRTGKLGNGQGRISGYFFLSSSGKVFVAEGFDGDFSNYSLVIGTHPMLLQDARVHPQAQEERYNKNEDGSQRLAYRSALGTKDHSDVCFIVSEEPYTMEEWAEFLEVQGYVDALNLDGGPISQLATQGGHVYGAGFVPTELIIFAKQK